MSDLNQIVQIAGMPGEAMHLPVNFILRNKGYVGLGTTENRLIRKDFWVFDFITEDWSRISEFPELISSTAAFAMNGKGYVLTGITENNINPHPGFWEYDPEADTWTRLADVGSGDGNADVAFVINGVAYGGLGVTSDGEERQEFWRYIPELD